MSCSSCSHARIDAARMAKAAVNDEARESPAQPKRSAPLRATEGDRRHPEDTLCRHRSAPMFFHICPAMARQATARRWQPAWRQHFRSRTARRPLVRVCHTAPPPRRPEAHRFGVCFATSEAAGRPEHTLTNQPAFVRPVLRLASLPRNHPVSETKTS